MLAMNRQTLKNALELPIMYSKKFIRPSTFFGIVFQRNHYQGPSKKSHNGNDIGVTSFALIKILFILIMLFLLEGFLDWLWRLYGEIRRTIKIP
jgi:hypothetical protein